eukprot:Hpha_TRINITY_DN15975_c1_g4::TRINITY_DN15975_c1_g4_i1::g.71333::m.71333/K02218/CSNK1, CKI; casein kinase 1
MSRSITIAGKYKVGRKLGSGSFGEIYEGTILDSSGRETSDCVAMKLEPVKTKHPQLLYESRLYKLLAGTGGSSRSHPVGLPRVHWYGVEGDYNIMVIDLLGPSLEDIFCFMGRKFSTKTTLMLGDQMVARIQFVHERHYLHRDVKPDNFLMGCNKRAHHVYVIDLGLAKKYRDPKTGRHIPPKEGKALTGTARYASINTHVGLEQGRRDDLEAVGYVLMYFLRGSLPWQGLKAKDKQEKYTAIKEKKERTSTESLCKGFPQEFVTYLNYCKSLRFEEEPDYNYLRRLFRDLYHREGHKTDYVFDWEAKRGQGGHQRRASSTRK